MTALAVLERRTALLEASRVSGSPVTLTPTAMAAAVGIQLDPWQAAVLNADKREALLLCSRQSGKSMVASLAALHQATTVAGSLILIVAPTERQSKLLLRSVKRFARRLPDAPTTVIENQLSLEFANGAEVFALPGSEHTIRGFSAVDVLIIDEGARVEDELYQSIRPMLAVSHGRLLALSTPFGQRGWFHHEYVNGGAHWHRARVPATDCPRIDPAWLAEERARIGDWWWRQEYNVEFLDTDDQLYGSDLVDAAVSADVKVRQLPTLAWSAA